MKNQVLFSSKDKSKINKMSSAAILFGALRVNIYAKIKTKCLKIIENWLDHV